MIAVPLGTATGIPSMVTLTSSSAIHPRWTSPPVRN
jgi:hypothetical protein